WKAIQQPPPMSPMPPIVVPSYTLKFLALSGRVAYQPLITSGSTQENLDVAPGGEPRPALRSSA
ncbi:MAG: hypothetical protein L0312_03815, partial [Acidobacteria bacterium]|nr:hypothetical protein [Acidobacteriota bacterium]